MDRTQMSTSVPPDQLSSLQPPAGDVTSHMARIEADNKNILNENAALRTELGEIRLLLGNLLLQN
jgi:hypothetical protein